MTPADKLEALLPCPFCGGAAMFRKALFISDGCTDAIIHATPTDCGMTDFCTDTTDESVIAAWNTRTAIRAEPMEAVPIGYVYSEIDAAGNKRKCGVLQGNYAQSLPNGTEIYAGGSPLGEAVPVAYIEEYTLGAGKSHERSYCGLVWTDHPAKTPGHTFTPLYTTPPATVPVEALRDALNLAISLRDYLVEIRDSQVLPRKVASYQRELDGVDAEIFRLTTLIAAQEKP